MQIVNTNKKIPEKLRDVCLRIGIVCVSQEVIKKSKGNK